MSSLSSDKIARVVNSLTEGRWRMVVAAELINSLADALEEKHKCHNLMCKGGQVLMPADTGPLHYRACTLCRGMGFDRDRFVHIAEKTVEVNTHPGHTKLCHVYDGFPCDCYRDPRSTLYAKAREEGRV